MYEQSAWLFCVKGAEGQGLAVKWAYERRIRLGRVGEEPDIVVRGGQGSKVRWACKERVWLG